MNETDNFDSEYSWIVRTCMNSINVYLTMLHFTFYDNAVNVQPNTTLAEALSYPLFMGVVDLLVYTILQ
ncbi:hypothetical protein WN55_02738 [Dufourea novaeangliae]|uniref:Uncharacterized protein n=1 Tax=Dufourea novaeangliae TaxID=178035 RepID=A0A154NXI3_DUFNO|nr:hypothetical protein WN55_02738 [Dufourea novaeangliae]